MTTGPVDEMDISPTKQLLIERGLGLLLRHGYNDLGIAALLDAVDVPKGSFYHHFKNKEDFALHAIAWYMREVHRALDVGLNDQTLAPLQRVRRFFELSEAKYRGEGYLGCLLGGLGQELSGVSEVFRHTVEQCFESIAVRIAACLDEALASGDLPTGTDTRQMADLLINCWEGAALRCRLRRDPEPLRDMLDFYFRSARRGNQLIR